MDRRIKNVELNLDFDFGFWNLILDFDFKFLFAFTNTGGVKTEFDGTELRCLDCKEGAERETRVRDMYNDYTEPYKVRTEYDDTEPWR